MANHTPSISNPDTEALVDMLTAQESTEWLGISVSLGREAAGLLHAAPVNPEAGARLAAAIEDGIIGDRCVLTRPLADALWVALKDIAETAFPQAREATRLAAVFRHVSDQSL